MDLNDQLNYNQLNIELELPLINQDNFIGFDLGELVHKAMNTYHLEPESGI